MFRRDITVVAFGLALVASACSTSVSELELGMEDVDFGVLVVLDGQRSAVSISPPYATRDGEVVFGSLPSVSLDGDQSAAFVGIKRSDLVSTIRGYDPEQPESIKIELGAPPSQPTLQIEGADWQVDLALPTTTRVLGAGGETIPPQVILAQLKLSVTINPEICDQQGPLHTRPFGETLIPFPPVGVPYAGLANSGAREIEQLLRLDDGRLLVLTTSTVIIVEPGRNIASGPYVPGVGPVAVGFYLDGPYARPHRLRSMALSPIRRADGRSTLVVIGETASTFGTIHELAVGPDGLESLGTSTVAQRPFPMMSDVAIDQLGNTVVVGYEGMYLVRRAGELSFDAPRNIGTTRRIRKLSFTGRTDFPFVGGSDEGFVWFGNPLNDEWESIRVGEGVVSIHFRGFGESNGQLWGAGQEGVMVRKLPDEAWKQIRVMTPPSFELCSGRPSPGEPLGISADITAFASSSAGIAIAPKECTSFIYIRPSDLCVTSVLREGRPTAATDDRIMALWMSDDEIIMGTSLGEIHVVNLN